MKFDQDLFKNFDMTKEVTLVSRTQPSGPLCLSQCLDLLDIKNLFAEKQCNNEKEWFGSKNLQLI